MPDWIETILQWLLDVLLWIPRKIYGLILDALAAVINAIPVPDFITNLGPNVSAAFGAIGWWAELAMIPEGVTLILSAYVLRFLVRRLPLVG